MVGTTRICPNCGSTDIGVDRSNVISLMALQSSYECNECGYAGIFPEVDDDDAAQQSAAIKERGTLLNHVPDRPVGNNQVFAGVLLVLVGIFPTFYARSLNGRIAGILALLIGGGILLKRFVQR